MNIEYKSAEELLEVLKHLKVADLREVAREFSVIPRNLRRDELMDKIMSVYRGEIDPEQPKKRGRPSKSANEIAAPPAHIKQRPTNTYDRSVGYESDDDGVPPEYPREGILEVMQDGYGFVRTNNYSTTPYRDYYLSANMIVRLGLRHGDKLKVMLRKYPDRPTPTAVFVKEVNDQHCNSSRRPAFESLEPCFPNSRINMETEKGEYSLRVLDLVAPIGKGQRGLIVAPPKTGKTILLKKIATAIRKNHPEIHLTVLLIDERPEEVTDFKENVDCEVVYSTFDQQPANHCHVAELVFANARRRVEQGQDVMILLDSITRLARAYNQIAEQSGRTMTGGLDIAALQEPKKMFGAGRNIRSGGSLTILATALIDTGSRMDDIIYEEFKGTGNMEIHLDRRISELRIFPAIDLNRSGTRREELLLSQSQLEGMYLIRRMLSREDSVQAAEELLEVVMSTSNNAETIETLKRLVHSNEVLRAMKKKS